MSKSYQQEIPNARVNITLDVETEGAMKKKELPLKMLVMGDYSRGQSAGAISDRERLNINKINFNQVLTSLSPKLNLNLPNQLNTEEDELPVSLTFESISDFKPEQIIDQIPELQRLMAMRNLLKDLKANIIDNKAFRKALENILNNKEDAKNLLNQLANQSPLENKLQ